MGTLFISMNLRNVLFAGNHQCWTRSTHYSDFRNSEYFLWISSYNKLFLDCLDNIDVTTEFYYSNIPLSVLLLFFYALVSPVSRICLFHTCLRVDCNELMLFYIRANF